MKRSFSVKALSVLLAAVLSISMLNGLAVNPRAADAGDTYVYIPIKDLSNASRYEGATIAENFMDTSIGGIPECGNYTLLLQNPTDFVEYDIDLADDVANAVLKVHAKHAEVSVKAFGGEFVTLAAKNGAAADRGVNLFDLTEANALASADNRFTVRLGFKDQAVVLNGLAVVAQQPELADTYELNPLGESYLQNVVDVSAGATRYFLDGTVPTVYLHNGEYVSFYFDFADNAESISYNFNYAGAPMTGAVSADGTSWTALPAVSGNVEKVIALSENKTFYLRFSADAGETFLSSLRLSPKLTNVIGDRLYLPLYSLDTANEYGGTGLYQGYNDTYQDGGTATNPTLLLQAAGDYVSYNMDMDDAVTSAQLKLYITGGKVEVKPAGGEFVTLTAKNGSGFNRNVAIYDLTEENALAAANNSFTLRISYDGSTVVLNSLLIQTAAPELSESYTLNPLGESYLQSVVDVSVGATRYFANGNEPTVFLHTGEHVTVHMDFIDDAMGVLYAYAQLGNPLTAEVSENGSNWTAMPSANGRIEDLISLPSDKTFYLRFTANAGDAFLQSVTLSPVTATYTDAGTELYLPLNSLSAANQYGGSGLAENYNDSFTGGDDSKVNNKTLLLQAAGDYVEYRLDMDDAVTTAQLKLYITGGKVEVKPAGGDYITLTAKNGSGFNRNVAIFDLTQADALASADNKFVLRISYNGSTVVLNSLLVQAETTKISGSYTLDPLGESYLQNVVDVSAGTTRYFLNGDQPTVFLHTGEQVTFRFAFADQVQGALTNFTQAGAALTAEVSTNGSVWTPIVSGAYVDHDVFFLRFTAESGDAFLSGLTLQAHDHKYSDWVITKPATVTEAGQQEKVCAGCGSKVVEEIAIIDSPIYGWSIALGDDIGVKFYAQMSDKDAENAVMYFTVAGVTTESAATKTENGDYVFVANVAAAQMNESIEAVLVLNEKTTNCGQYSVRSYAERILSGDYSDATKNLVKAMLNYGAKAQSYFDYDAQNPANAGYEMESVVSVPAENMIVSTTGSIADMQFYGASVVFKNKVAVRFYFKAENLNDVTFRVGENAYEAVKKEEGLYYIEVDGINPQDYCTVINLVASNGTSSLTVGYSPMHYITRMYHKAQSSDALKDLMLAVYNYYDAATKYMSELA